MADQVHSWANAIQGLRDRWCLVRVGIQAVSMVKTPTVPLESPSPKAIAQIKAANIVKYGRERDKVLVGVEKRVQEAEQEAGTERDREKADLERA